MLKLIPLFLAAMVLFPYISYTQVDSNFFLNYSKKLNSLNEDLGNYIKKSIDLNDVINNSDLRIAELQRKDIDRCYDSLQYMFHIYSMFAYIYNETDQYNYENLILKTIEYSRFVINELITDTNRNLDYANDQSVISSANDFKSYSKEILETLQKWENDISKKHPKNN